MRSKESDKQKAAALLQEDIINSPLHCFGSHHKCKSDYCKVVRLLEKSDSNKDNIAQPIPCPQSSMTTSTDVNNFSFSSTCSNSTLASGQSDDANSVTDTSISRCKILELSDMELR